MRRGSRKTVWRTTWTVSQLIKPICDGIFGVKLAVIFYAHFPKKCYYVFQVSCVVLLAPPSGAQCLEASTFSSSLKCFGNRFFCIFCKPHTYSHPFLPTLASYKKIWPIYGFVHFSVTKKRAKLGSNLKHLINENFRFQSSIYDFFLLNTSHSEDMRQKNPN